MAESYDVFDSCLLLKEIFKDDLGRLFRAATIEENAIRRNIWLRILDGDGLSGDVLSQTFEQARLIDEALTGSQLAKDPLFLLSDGIAALGCRYVAGQPLNRVLARARDEAFPLQPDNSLLIVEKLALTLAAAAGVERAGKPLVHGFLHPGLIYLSNDGEATVTGFGVGETLLAALEDPNSLSGGRAYLAPEVLAGEGPSQSGDVYSLGAILFHLLTGTALPVAVEDRMAALTAAHVVWDGEAPAADIRSILSRTLAPEAGDRFSCASDFRDDLDKLIYGGAYSSSTFNLALFMDRLFRQEIDEDETVLGTLSEIDITPYLVTGRDAQGAVTDEPAGPPDDSIIGPEAIPPTPTGKGKRVLWFAVGGAAIIGIAAVVFWIGRGTGVEQPPPTPTPTAAEIAARRQAQEDRLRTLTQEMVQEMMAEREEEIRQELITRQTRIEELQTRLQTSERRAAQSAAAATTEAETQRKLMREIEEQEEAQRTQQEALEAERDEALAAAVEPSSVVAATAGESEVADEVPSPGDGATDKEFSATEGSPPSQMPSPTMLPLSTASPVPVTIGAFFPPEKVDTLPVVVKSQSLIWPRNAQRSRGKGVVVIQQKVNASGGVDEVVILRADHTGWGIPEAALEAARGYRYKPGTKNGVAITTHTFVTWRYDFTKE